MIMVIVVINCGRCDGVMVRVFVFGLSCCLSYCDGFLGKIFYFWFIFFYGLIGDFNVIGNFVLDEYYI